MLIAMGITAGLCIFIGVYPTILTPLLPNVAEYEAYTPTHVLTQLQMLLFAALAFVVLMRTGLYPKELAAINLDSDWIYRRLLPGLWARVEWVGGGLTSAARRGGERLLGWTLTGVYRHHGPEGLLARSWASAGSVFWVCLLLLVCLIVYYS